MPGITNLADLRRVVQHQQAQTRRRWVRQRQPELKTYRFVVAYKQANDGNTPTMRQIMDGTGIASTNTVTAHLDKLERLRMITRKGGQVKVIGGKWTPPEDTNA